MAKAILVFVGSPKDSALEGAMTELIKLHKDYVQKGLSIYGVVTENQQGMVDRQSVLDAAFGLKSVLEIPFQVLSDPAATATKPILGSDSLPLTLLLDNTKVIRFKQAGAAPDFTRLRGYLDTLLP